jgi:hypothetical protein
MREFLNLKDNLHTQFKTKDHLLEAQTHQLEKVHRSQRVEAEVEELITHL